MGVMGTANPMNPAGAAGTPAAPHIRPPRAERQPGWTKPGSVPAAPSIDAAPLGGVGASPVPGAPPSIMPAAPPTMGAAPITGDTFGTMGRTAEHAASTGGNALTGAMSGAPPSPLDPMTAVKKQMSGGGPLGRTI